MSRRGDRVLTLPNGRFRARLVTLRGRQTRNFATYQEAEEWLAAARLEDARLRRDVSRGRARPGQLPTLAEFADSWLAAGLAVEDGWAYSTRCGYEGDVAIIKHGSLGAMRVDRIAYHHVESWLGDLAAAKRGDGRYRYGAVTAASLLGLLKRIIGRAHLEHGLVGWDWDHLRFPKQLRARKRPRRPALTARELGAFLTALEAPYYADGGWRALFWIMAATGARPCEVLALRRRHVDLAAGMIRIESSAYRGVLRDETKTGDPRRPAIPAALADVLRPHLEGLDEGPEALLFPPEATSEQRSRKRRLPPGAVVARGGDTLDKPFQRALADAGIDKPGVTPYSLRNTFNTLALKVGADGITLRDVMGHSTASMTERYARTEHDDRAALQSRVMAEVIRH